MHIMGRYSNQTVAPDLLVRCLALEDGSRVDATPRPAMRRLKDKLSDPDRTTLVAAYAAGTATIAGLAEQHGVSDYSIRMVLRAAGIGPKRRTVTAEHTMQVIELWRRGMSVVAIAAEAGLGQSTVRLIVSGVDRG